MTIDQVLASLAGKEVTQVRPGHGTFLTLDINAGPREEPMALWVYIASWAFVLAGEEVASYDRKGDPDSLKTILARFKGRIEKVHLFDDEVHICLENDHCLEIWSAEDGSSPDEAIHVFQGDKCLGTKIL